MIIDHIGLAVSDYDSKRFFTQALAPLGIELVMEAIFPTRNSAAHRSSHAAMRCACRSSCATGMASVRAH